MEGTGPAVASWGMADGHDADTPSGTHVRRVAERASLDGTEQPPGFGLQVGVVGEDPRALARLIGGCSSSSSRRTRCGPTLWRIFNSLHEMPALEEFLVRRQIGHPV